MADLLGTALNGAVTLIAAFGGVWAAGRNQRVSDSATAARAREQHVRETRSRLDEDLHRDQLGLLRTVQEEVQEVVRTTSRMIQWDLTLVREGGDSTAFPTDLSAQDHDVRSRLAMHVSRVLDEQVRDAVAALTLECAQLTTVPLLSRDVTTKTAAKETERRLLVLLEVSESTQALIGTTVRTEAAWRP